MMVKILECPMVFSLMEKDLTDTMTLLSLMGSISKQLQSILVSIISFFFYVYPRVCFCLFFGFLMEDILL